MGNAFQAWVTDHRHAIVLILQGEHNYDNFTMEWKSAFVEIEFHTGKWLGDNMMEASILN